MTKSKGIRGPRQYWNEQDVAVLRQRYPNETAAVVANALQRSEAQIYQKAKSLGLTKSVEFFASPASGRTDGQQGTSTRFGKGSTPWNKGTHFVSGGRSAETRFKPGSPPKNRKPIGSERINSDGYLQRKVADSGYPPDDWQGIHILNWITAHGPIPPGHAVVFKDKDKTNVALGNLELLSRTELMKRNTRHNLPKELADLIVLKSAITRQINKRIKNEQ